MPSYTDIGSVYGGYPAINSAQAVSGLSSGVVLGFINQVESELDAAIGGRYSLPFSNGCPILATLALRETIFRLCMERGLVHFPPALQGKAPLAVQHDMDQKILAKIVEGTYSLLDNSKQVIAQSITDRGEIYSSTMNFNPAFHEGNPLDMVRDTDKLEAILSDRKGRGL